MPFCCATFLHIQPVRSIPCVSRAHVFIPVRQNTIWAENMGMFIYIFAIDIGVLILFFLVREATIYLSEDIGLVSLVNCF